MVEQVTVLLIDLNQPITAATAGDSENKMNNFHMLLKRHMMNHSLERLKFLNAKSDLLMIIDYYPQIMHEDLNVMISEDSTTFKLLTNDEELMTRAVMSDGSLIKHITCRELFQKLALKSVQQEGMNIELIDNETIGKLDLLREAVKQNGNALSIIPSDSDLITDDVVVTAVRNDPTINDNLSFEHTQNIQGDLLDYVCVKHPYFYEEYFVDDDDEYGMEVDASVAKYIALFYGHLKALIVRYGNDDITHIDLLKTILKKHPRSIERVSTHYGVMSVQYKELLRISIKYSQEVFDNYDMGFDDEYWSRMVKYCGETLYYVKNQTKELVLKAVKNNGEAIEYANNDDDEFYKCKELILEAVKTDPGAIQYAADELYQDDDFILECVKENGEALSYVWEDYGDDREIVLAAVSNSGAMLEYASEELQHDREIVLAAVNNDGMALQYSQLGQDEEITLKAISNGYELPSGCTSEFLDFIAKIVQKNYHYLSSIRTELLDWWLSPLFMMPAWATGFDRKEFALKVVKSNCVNLTYLPTEFKNDRDIVSVAVKLDGMMLKHASDELKDDIDIAMEAVKSNPFSIIHVSDRLKRNWRLQKLAKELKEQDYKNWFNYWGERSKVYDVPKPKRYREEEDSNLDDDYDDNQSSSSDEEDSLSDSSEEYQIEYCSSESESESEDEGMQFKKRKVE